MKYVMMIGMLLVASAASAQTATDRRFLAWEQVAGDLAEAQSYTHRFYDDVDGVRVIDNTSKKCGTTAVVGEFTCVAPFPSVTPGNHNATLTAEYEGLESLPSNVLAYRFVVVPNPPRNLRITNQQ